jgi:hypothetical protein
MWPAAQATSQRSNQHLASWITAVSVSVVEFGVQHLRQRLFLGSLIAVAVVARCGHEALESPQLCCIDLVCVELFCLLELLNWRFRVVVQLGLLIIPVLPAHQLSANARTLVVLLFLFNIAV